MYNIKKEKTVYVCQSCGNKSSKWVGKCTACGEWNTYQEEKDTYTKLSKNHTLIGLDVQPMKLDEISSIKTTRINTGIEELNNVLGGGIVPGSLILLSGEPGVGKSTLVLQLFKNTKLQILYVSGEESPEQIKMRAERLGIINKESLIYTETNVENIISQIEKIKPNLVIIDSIQTIYTVSLESTIGTVSQIRESASLLQNSVKKHSIPLVLIGHINKEGSIAGPKILEHIVDVVLYFEGDKNMMFRVLRASKNRFGSTAEIGLFELLDSGLEEVKNPSEVLTVKHNENFSGVAIASAVEGIKPFLIEIQALVCNSVYSVPQRSSTGFDMRRLNMLLAVLEKRLNFRIGNKDIFINVIGGIKIEDTALDLAIVSSIISSGLNIPINNNICFAAEVGLSGEIRPVNKIEQRIKEANKFGIKQIFISAYQKKVDFASKDIEIVKISKVDELMKVVFKIQRNNIGD